MLFDSLTFFIFFLIVYGVYPLLDRRAQNVLLLLASYVFYGCWDWRFLFLLWLTTLTDYYLGLKIDNASAANVRKRWLWISVTVNLGVLSIFKYFDFFADNLLALLTAFGIETTSRSLHLILPVGISFYTFQSLGYTIDVYRREVRARRNLLDFALFIAFFPQLIAGPIERAKRLLPQIERSRSITWDHLVSGSYLFFWGLFQKVFVADNLATIVERVYSGKPPYNGAEVATAGIAFAFQLLCDFGGYSNMARGVAKLLGFELSVNFRAPCFAPNLREFWQRWHITLGTWFRDYCYRPLKELFPSNTKSVQGFCVLVTFLMVGLWHGASWNFVLWGALVAVQLLTYLAIQPLLQRFISPQHTLWRFGWYLASIFAVNVSMILGSCLFLAATLEQSIQLYSALFGSFNVTPMVRADVVKIVFYLSPFLVLEFLQYVKDDALAVLRLPLPLRSAAYVTIFYSVIWFGKLDGEKFIYFQF